MFVCVTGTAVNISTTITKPTVCMSVCPSVIFHGSASIDIKAKTVSYGIMEFVSEACIAIKSCHSKL